MKMKLIAVLVGSAIAGLATTSASAGTLQPFFKNYAAEVFASDSVSVLLPTVTYGLISPLSGNSVNPTTIKYELTLAAGKFDKNILASAVLRSNVQGQALNATQIAYTNNDQTVTFTFVLNVDGQTFGVGSTITAGDSDSGSVNGPAGDKFSHALQGLNLASILGAPMKDACNPTTAHVNLTVRITDGNGVEFDSIDGAAINTRAYLNSAVALKVSGYSSALISPKPEQSKVNLLIQGSEALVFTDGANDVTTSVTSGTINLGAVTLEDRNFPNLYDGDAAHAYTFGLVTANAATGQTPNDGAIGASSLNLTIKGKFASDLVTANYKNVWLSKTPDCLAAGNLTATEAKINAVGDTATFTVPFTDADFISIPAGVPVAVASPQVTPPLAAATKRIAFVCYAPDVRATPLTVIPTAQFQLAGGALVKGAGSNEIDDPVCPVPLYNLTANGVQLDVRNYIQSEVTAATGWSSTLRIINTDENNTAVVSAQLIKDDGTLLASAPIVTLPPRAFKYMTATDIDAMLPVKAGFSTHNARLRITSQNRSIRVQNYQFNPASGNFLEASSAQGDEANIADSILENR